MKCLRRFRSTLKNAQIGLFSASYCILNLCFPFPINLQIGQSLKQAVAAAASACFTSLSHTGTCDYKPLSNWSAAPAPKKRGSYSLTWPPTPVTSRRLQSPERHSDMWAFQFKSSWLTENWYILPSPPPSPPSPSSFLPASILVNEPVHRERCSSCLSHSCSPIKRNGDGQRGGCRLREKTKLGKQSAQCCQLISHATKNYEVVFFFPGTFPSFGLCVRVVFLYR